MKIFHLIVGVSLLLIMSPNTVVSQTNESDTTKGSPSWVAYPAIGYQPETGFQFGAIAVGVLNSMDSSQSEYARQSSFTPFFVYTTKNQILTAFNIDYYFPNGNNLNITPRLFKFPDKFFGVGNANDPDVFETYTNRFWRLEGQYLIPQSPRIFIGGAIDLETSKLKEVKAGGILENGTILGSNGGSLIGLGPSFRFDSRDNVIYPSSGYLINAGCLFTYIGDFSYTRYLLDIRRYISIRDNRDVLALQVAGIFTGGHDIPFYRLPRLGGDDRLRGIANSSLYRDRQAVLSQVEYRKYLFWRVGAVAFVGAGNVANEFGDFSLSDFKYAAGVGFRFQVVPDQKLNLRLDLGFANGGQSAFYVSMREAF
jgi:hypothetical protein